jgi:tape measure domain-containing protein
MSDSKLRVIISAHLKEFERAMSKAEAKLNKFGDEATKLGGIMTASVSVPIIAAGVKAVKTAANFEKLQTQLNVLSGSADKGAKSFQRLVKFSAGTPFQLDELVKANNTLLGFGVSSEVAFDSLKAIGDIAAVSGGDMQGITVAFGQAAAAGRLMGQDLLQLVNNGVPIIDLLSKSMGVAKEEIKDMVSEGAVTFDVLLKAFKDATTNGGQFENGMKILSGTLNGVASTLQDNVNIAFAELGKVIVEEYDLINNTQRLTKRIQGLTKQLKDADPATKSFVVNTTSMAAAIGPLVLSLGLASKALPTLAKGMRMLGGGPVIAGVMAAVTAFDQLSLKIAENLNLVDRFKIALANIGNIFDPFGMQQMAAKNIEAEWLNNYEADANETAKAVDDILSKDSSLKFIEAKDLADLQRFNQEISNVAASITDPITSEGITKIIEGLEDPISQLELDANATANAIDDMLNQDAGLTFAIAAADAQMESFEDKVRRVAEIFRELKGEQKETKDEFNQLSAVIADAVANSFTSLGEAIGSALQGIGSLAENVKNALGSTLANLLIDIGKAAIQVGTALAAVKESLKSLNPAVAIAAGVGLVAIGTYFKGKMNSASDSIKAFANGGIISGPTLGLMGEYAGAKSNPEVVAPLDRLKNLIGGSQNNMNVSGEFRVQGQDLVVALERANKQRGNFL